MQVWGLVEIRLLLLSRKHSCGVARLRRDETLMPVQDWHVAKTRQPEAESDDPHKNWYQSATALPRTFHLPDNSVNV